TNSTRARRSTTSARAAAPTPSTAAGPIRRHTGSTWRAWASTPIAILPRCRCSMAPTIQATPAKCASPGICASCRTMFRRGGIQKGRLRGAALSRLVRKTGLLLLQRQAAEALIELSHAATLIDLARTASPRRVAGRIDVQRQRVAFAAPGGARLEHGAVGHLHLDHVVVGVNVGLHGGTSFVHEAGSDRPGNVGKGARLQSCAADCNSL